MNIEINSEKWNLLNSEQQKAFQLELVKAGHIKESDILTPTHTQAWSHDDSISNEECDMQAQWNYEICIKAGFEKKECAEAAWKDYLDCVE